MVESDLRLNKLHLNKKYVATVTVQLVLYHLLSSQVRQLLCCDYAFSLVRLLLANCFPLDWVYLSPPSFVKLGLLLPQCFEQRGFVRCLSDDPGHHGNSRVASTQCLLPYLPFYLGFVIRVGICNSRSKYFFPFGLFCCSDVKLVDGESSGLWWWFNGVFLCTAVAGKVLKGELAVVNLLPEV